MNTGIIVTCPGSIRVLSMITNQTSRPGQRSLAKEYATIDEERSVPSIVLPVIKSVLSV